VSSAISRGGLVVDYIGLAEQLRQALATYTESGGRGKPSIDTTEAVSVMMEKYESLCSLLHGLDWKPAAQDPRLTLQLLPAAQEHVLQQPNGKQRLIQLVLDLSKAFALCAASDEARSIRDHVALFQALKAALAKGSGDSGRSPEQLDAAVRQLVSRAIVPDGEIIDIFKAAGLRKPDISILSEEFLVEVRGLKHKNVAAELLAKLLGGEIRALARRNVVKSESFAARLQKTLNAYHNRAIATTEIIEELIRLARELKAANERGERLGLSQEEIAFYDALATNQSAVEVMGDDRLKVIATELVGKVRQSVSIDWTRRDGARALIRVMIKRVLRQYGYPPDLQEEAVKKVLQQAELLCAEWAPA
jgi:type I restriction enzyme R subunit